ncbi:hypothetical protein JZ751_002307 [Albula glossodonta]|uniref:ZP-C domain-containing protein n=1 Tax=Albula glossodonta TaxID=121402 RepID=A0A8T2PBH5_9TELE|nr:hypothetical protein JZ751_002307 [Albula glossodonta]
MQKQTEDLEQFLKNVDEISKLVKELNSSSGGCQERAMEEADRLISSWEKDESCKTRLNRTVINTNPSKHDTAPTGVQGDCEMSSENFMRILEQDAKDRAERRKENEALANALKTKGNEAYARGDYGTAVLHYSDGLQKLRSMPALYTNRAQAYIKLQKYKEAISDCDWALRCDEKCIKALIHMGRANQALKNYTEARACYQRILEIEPEKATLVKDYLTRVDLEEKKEVEEKGAWEEFEKGKEKTVAVPRLLEKLNQPEWINMYYCGGLELLSQIITDCTGQMLFRLNNGFSIISDNETNSSAPFTDELCISVLKVWNAENQRLLLQYSMAKECVVQLLASGNAEVQSQCLELLCLYTQTEHGLRLVTSLLYLHKLVENLMNCLLHEESFAERVLAVLDHLAGEKQFRILMRENYTTLFVPPFVRHLRNITPSSYSLLPSLISVMFSMNLDDVICRETALCKEFWEACLVALDQCSHCENKDVLSAVLGMLIKISFSPSPTVRDYAVPISSRCLALVSCTDGHVITRSAGVLSFVLQQSHDAIEEAVREGVVKIMLKLLKCSGQTTTRYCIKTLAVCTAVSQQARADLLKQDKKLQTLRRLVSGAGLVEAGNAALSLGHCLDIPGVATALVGTDVVLQLLRLAAGNHGNAGKPGNTRNTGNTQQNAAITLGKLCTAEPSFAIFPLHGKRQTTAEDAVKQDSQSWGTEGPSFTTVLLLEDQTDTVGRGGKTAIDNLPSDLHPASQGANLFPSADESQGYDGENSAKAAAKDVITSRVAGPVFTDQSESADNDSSRTTLTDELNLMSDQEAAPSNSRIAGEELVTSSMSTSSNHLSDGRESRAVLQAQLNSSNLEITEYMALLLTDTGQSIPLVSASSISEVDKPKQPNSAQKKRGKDEGKNEILEPFVIMHPLKEEESIFSEEEEKEEDETSLIRISAESLSLQALPGKDKDIFGLNSVPGTEGKDNTEITSKSPTPATASSVVHKLFPMETDMLKSKEFVPNKGLGLSPSSSRNVSFFLSLPLKNGATTTADSFIQTSAESRKTTGMMPSTMKKDLVTTLRVNDPISKANSNASLSLSTQPAGNDRESPAGGQSKALLANVAPLPLPLLDPFTSLRVTHTTRRGTVSPAFHATSSPQRNTVVSLLTPRSLTQGQLHETQHRKSLSTPMKASEGFSRNDHIFFTARADNMLSKPLQLLTGSTVNIGPEFEFEAESKQLEDMQSSAEITTSLVGPTFTPIKTQPLHQNLEINKVSGSGAQVKGVTRGPPSILFSQLAKLNVTLLINRKDSFELSPSGFTSATQQGEAPTMMCSNCFATKSSHPSLRVMPTMRPPPSIHSKIQIVTQVPEESPTTPNSVEELPLHSLREGGMPLLLDSNMTGQGSPKPYFTATKQTSTLPSRQAFFQLSSLITRGGLTGLERTDLKDLSTEAYTLKQETFSKSKSAELESAKIATGLSTAGRAMLSSLRYISQTTNNLQEKGTASSAAQSIALSVHRLEGNGRAVIHIPTQPLASTVSQHLQNANHTTEKLKPLAARINQPFSSSQSVAAIYTATLGSEERENVLSNNNNHQGEVENRTMQVSLFTQAELLKTPHRYAVDMEEEPASIPVVPTTVNIISTSPLRKQHSGPTKQTVSSENVFVSIPLANQKAPLSTTPQNIVKQMAIPALVVLSGNTNSSSGSLIFNLDSSHREQNQRENIEFGTPLEKHEGAPIPESVLDANSASVGMLSLLSSPTVAVRMRSSAQLLGPVIRTELRTISQTQLFVPNLHPNMLHSSTALTKAPVLNRLENQDTSEHVVSDSTATEDDLGLLANNQLSDMVEKALITSHAAQTSKKSGHMLSSTQAPNDRIPTSSPADMDPTVRVSRSSTPVHNNEGQSALVKIDFPPFTNEADIFMQSTRKQNTGLAIFQGSFSPTVEMDLGESRPTDGLELQRMETESVPLHSGGSDGQSLFVKTLKKTRKSLIQSEPALMGRMRLVSPDPFISGLAVVSDDVCGMGNYTAEMKLNLNKDVVPGDIVPALGNLHVVINLKTNNSLVNLTVKSCCLSPTAQPDEMNATCCVFSRLPTVPVGIILLPSNLSKRASFMISLFQMINYSTAYLHCDVSVCLGNHTDCERQCLQHRRLYTEEGVVTVFSNPNRISFGPLLKGTDFLSISSLGMERIVIALAAICGCLLMTVILLLFWLAGRHRSGWRPFHQAGGACCPSSRSVDPVQA